jgi:hypothetical protein
MASRPVAWADKKRLVEGDVLQGHEIIIALEIQDLIDQQKGIAVR